MSDLSVAPRALLRRQPDTRDHRLPLRHVSAEIVGGVGAIADPELGLQGCQLALVEASRSTSFTARFSFCRIATSVRAGAKMPTQVDATMGKPLSA